MLLALCLLGTGFFAIAAISFVLALAVELLKLIIRIFRALRS